MIYENECFEDLKYEGDCVEEKTFIDCDFYKCKFYEIEVRHCSFRGCTFRDCTILNLNFKYTDAAANDFENCSILGLAWDDLKPENNVMLPFSSFNHCTLKHNIFAGFSMKKFSFANCDLSGSSIEQCDLQNSSFNGAQLKGVNFQLNNLMGADFRDALDYGISIEQNKLKKAKFSFPDAIQLLTASGIVVE